MNNTELKYRLVERMKTLTPEQMIEVSHALNRWDTHKLIEDIMPTGWTWDRSEPISKAPQSVAARYVTETVGRKAELRYHNVVVGDMTPEGFEEWWNKKGWYGLEGY